MSTELVRYQPLLGKALFHRRGLLFDLQGRLQALEQEYLQGVNKLREFERRYQPAVGDRYDELELLREKINRAWEALGQAQNGESGDAYTSEASVKQNGHRDSEVIDEARRMFLKLVRQIHPDFASDPEEREHRHEIMAEATLAYRDNDTPRLQWLLEHWQAEAEPIDGYGMGSLLSKTNRQIAWVRYRLRELHYSINQLHSSPLARIMAEQEIARRTGRNLILEMRKQIQEDIRTAHQDLERVCLAIDDLDPEIINSIKNKAGL